MPVLFPHTYGLSDTEPLIFLAGPIQGATNWQREATSILMDLDPSSLVANPRQPHATEADFANEADFNLQVEWETHHLNQAGRYHGVIMFWLAREAVHDPRRAYAQTTRFELGEWKERARRGEAVIVVGIEDGFPGARYLRRRLAQDCPQLTIHTTLKATCQAAYNCLLAQVARSE